MGDQEVGMVFPSHSLPGIQFGQGATHPQGGQSLLRQLEFRFQGTMCSKDLGPSSILYLISVSLNKHYDHL